MVTTQLSPVRRDSTSTPCSRTPGVVRGRGAQEAVRGGADQSAGLRSPRRWTGSWRCSPRRSARRRWTTSSPSSRQGTPALLLDDPLPIVNLGLAPAEEPGAGHESLHAPGAAAARSRKGDIRGFSRSSGAMGPAMIPGTATTRIPTSRTSPRRSCSSGRGNQQPRGLQRRATSRAAGCSELVLLYPGPGRVRQRRRGIDLSPRCSRPASSGGSPTTRSCSAASSAHQPEPEPASPVRRGTLAAGGRGAKSPRRAGSETEVRRSRDLRHRRRRRRFHLRPVLRDPEARPGT